MSQVVALPRARHYLEGMTDKPKRPKDANQLAKFIVDVATGEDNPTVVKEETDQSAKAKGAKARARSLNQEQRSEIASIAATARWKKGD